MSKLREVEAEVFNAFISVVGDKACVEVFFDLGNMVMRTSPMLATSDRLKALMDACGTVQFEKMKGRPVRLRFREDSIVAVGHREHDRWRYW